MVEGEVLQLVGADLRLGGLDLLSGASRDELGGDFRPQHGLQDDIGGFVKLARRNAPPDEMLDEGLRHAGVDPVVAHLVADAEGAPPQGQLGQVSGPQHDAASLIGDAEEVVVTQTSLDVLEGDVIDVSPVTGRVPHPPEHLGGCRADVQHLAGNAECLAQVQGVVFGVVGGGEPWHREGEDVGAGTAHLVHRLGCDEQGMGGVEASRDADDDLGSSDRLEATTQAVDLDVVGLVAVLGELVWLVGDEGEPVDGSLETDVLMRRGEGEGTGPPALVTRMGEGIVVEGTLTHPLLTQQIEVDVSEAVPRLGGEPVGGRQ